MFDKLAIALMANPVSADIGDTITNKFNTEIIPVLQKIATPIAIAAIVFCGFYWIMGSDPQNLQKAKHGLIAAVIGLGIVWLAIPIVNEVVGIFQG